MGLLKVGKSVFTGGKSLFTGGWKALGGLGSHTKGALLVSGATIGGWQYLSTGHVPGEGLVKSTAQAAEKVVDVIPKAADALGKGADTVGKGLDLVNGGLDKVSEKGPGLISDTKKALTGDGQGGGLFDSLFGGVGKLLGGLFNGGTGNMLGLVAGAFLLFGGFGWMGKIGGVLLAALSLGLLGGNSQQQVAVQQQPLRQDTSQVVSRSRDAEGYSFLNQGDGSSFLEEESSPVVHRSR